MVNIQLKYNLIVDDQFKQDLILFFASHLSLRFNFSQVTSNRLIMIR